MPTPPPTLTTPRLTLRPLVLSDAGSVARLAGDWDVARMTGRIPHPYSLIDADRWIADVAPREFVRAIVHGGHLVGAVGYAEQDGGAIEIGYWIGKPFWGQGIATEAASALIDHCFRAERRRRLVCCHFVDNPASARVIVKLGFKRTGSGNMWCEARREHVAAIRYERRRPMLARLPFLGQQAS